LLLNLLFPDRLIVFSEESKNLIERYAPGFKMRIKKILGGVNLFFDLRNRRNVLRRVQN